MNDAPSSETLVWDLPLRLFHWTLALVLVACWATQEMGSRWMQVHMWLGYAAGALVIFRCLWGFAGPRHARFGSFLAGPRAVVAYLRAWLGGAPPHFAGHNPAGGWSVLAMLALVAGQVATGMMNSDDTFHAGPWHYEVPGRIADAAGRLHHDLFYGLAILAGVHIVAVLAYRWRPGVDLVRPMITGRKRTDDPGIDGSRPLRALLALLAAAALIVLAVVLAPAPDLADLGIY